jgi:fatty-acyl-CoA synthase
MDFGSGKPATEWLATAVACCGLAPSAWNVVPPRLRLLARLLPSVPKLLRYAWPGPWTFADRLEEQAAKRPEQPFVLFEDRRIGYAEFNAEANRIAHWAHRRGLRPRDVVALLMENRPEYIATWAGLAKLGIVTALINHNLRGRGLRHAIAAAGADHLIAGSECLDRFAAVAEDLERKLEVWVRPDAGFAGALPEGANNLDAALAAVPDTNPDPSLRRGLRTDAGLFYIYTSGTTGLPKAAHFSHMRFLAVGDLATWAMKFSPADVHYCALPLYHSAGGVMLVSTVLAAGATLALRRKFSARHFWEDVRRFRATGFQYIGEFCRYLVNQPPQPGEDNHRIRVAIGNGLRPDIWAEFQQRFAIPKIIEFYGATEGNTVVMNFENKIGSVGRFPFDIVSNARLIRFDVATETTVRDEKGLCVPCRTGEVGELVARISSSPGLPKGNFEGYTSEAATEKKILRDVFRRGDAWFRSGDLLRQDSDGFYYFVDRIGDTFRWKGENVSTQDVAEVLGAFPGLAMVNVYGVAIDGYDGRAGMAALQPEEGVPFDGEGFYAFLEEALPRYAAPVFVRLLREVDMTGTFKLRKVDLRREGFDVSKISDPVLAREDERGTYVPLTPQWLEEVRSGTRKL